MAGTAVFRADVNAEASVLHVRDKSALHEALAPFASQEVIVTVETADPITRGWRGYYYKVVVEAIRNKWTEQRGIPYSKDQVHDLLKRHFIGVVDGPVGGTVAKGTSDVDFNKDKFIEFVEEVCAYAAQELELIIPPPESQKR
jgi:hypothetical protein